MTVHTLPAREDADTLWQSYHALVKQCFENPALWGDRRHQEATIRAHKRFADAYLKEGGNA